MRIVRWLVAVVSVVMVLGGAVIAHIVWFKPLMIEIFYERLFIETLLDSPQMLTRMRILPSWVPDWYSDDLNDGSLEQEEKQRKKLFGDLATLRSYERKDQVGEKRTNYDMLEYFLAIAAEGDPYRHHDAPVNQLFGVQNELPTFMATQHEIASEKNAEDYLARLAKFPWRFEQVLTELRLREKEGILPQRFVIEKVLTEMQAFVATPVTDNILYSAFAKKLDGVDGLTDARRKELEEQAKTLVEKDVYPAYQTIIDYYTALLPKARGNNGVWELPDGDNYYAWQVRRHTTTDLTPDEVHNLGLAEVARIEGEMDAILKTQGLVDGSVGQRVQQLATRPDQLYTGEGARQQIIDDFQKIIDEIDAGLGSAFNVRPSTHVKVERVPEFREKTAPGAYYNAPSFDGLRPGVFYINLRNTAEVAKFGMRTLAYHEAIPGHHTQSAIQQELENVPTFRKVLPFTAFSEGWALYAERVAWEMGYEKDPLDNLGRLQAEMFRAVRLVVDTGMHHRRWSREQAIAYMTDKTGMTETDVVAEIERYLVMPGQALAYKVGMMKLLELREQAKAQLGDKFDLRAWHDFVLTGGDMPLTLLEERVANWIAERKTAA